MAKKTYKNVSAKNSLFELTSSVSSHPVPQTNNKKIKKNSKINKHYQGHRERLRNRYLKTKGNAIEDYEYLELLLSRTILRADIKPIAKNL
ncbi:MAG: hypothetical protein PV353_01885, partial [Bartonella sp.]|nr:hypothetical protein [Bartonella sp.]